MEMLEDWREDDSMKEDQINIDELLPTTAQGMRHMNPAIQSQASSQSNDLSQGLMIDTQTYNNVGITQKMPTFSSANRPSVLDLSTTVKAEGAYSTNSMNVNGHSPHSHQGASHSPHHHQRASPSPHPQVSHHHQRASPSPHPQVSQHLASPHHSPYINNQQVFNYNNMPQHDMSQHDMRSPVSPHPQQVSAGVCLLCYCLYKE